MPGRLPKHTLPRFSASPRNLWTSRPTAPVEQFLHPRNAWSTPLRIDYPGSRGLAYYIDKVARCDVDVEALCQTMDAVVRSDSSEPTEHYPIDPSLSDVHPRDLYLSLRARSPTHIQRLPKSALGEMFRLSIDHRGQMPLLPQLILDDLLVMTTWDPDARRVLEGCLRYQALRRKYRVVPHSKVLDVWEQVRAMHQSPAPASFSRPMLNLILVAILHTERYDEANLAFIAAAHPRLFLNAEAHQQETLREQEADLVFTGKEESEEDESEGYAPVPATTEPATGLPFHRTALHLIYQLTAHSHDNLALDVFKHLISVGYIPEAAMVQHSDAVPGEAEGAPSISAVEHFAFVLISTLVKTCLHLGYHDLAYDFMRSLKSKAMFDPAYRAAANKVVESLLLSGTEKDAEMLTGLVTAWAHDVALIHPLPDNMIWTLYDFCHQVNRPDLLTFIYQQLFVPPHENIYPLPQNHSLVALLTDLNWRKRHTEARTLMRNLVQHNYRIDPAHRADVIYQASKMGFATEARALYEKYEHRVNSGQILGRGGLTTELVAYFVRISENKKAKGDVDASEHARAFAQRVLANFIANKGELEREPRMTLNAIAHCHFLLGDLEAGFNTLRILLKRQEVPHENDVNVLLTAAVKYSPRAAVALLQSALRMKYKAGARAYAILLHGAQKMRDYDLVEEIVRLASEEGQLSKLDRTAKDSMLRAQLEPLLESRPENKQLAAAYMHNVYNTMCLAQQNNEKVNDALVHLAIKAAVATELLTWAFRLWRDFFRGRIPHERDPWKVWQFRLVKEIHQAVRAGKLEDEKGNQMIAVLKSSGTKMGKPFYKARQPFVLPGRGDGDTTTIEETGRTESERDGSTQHNTEDL